ncbi:MAG: exosortase/archaeosortase family protein [Kiritimatiellia bacterium]|jgi:exosortase/archaeosortase family protein
MNASRKSVVIATLLLFCVWLGMNWARISAQQDALITVVLGSIFALILMMRFKPETKSTRKGLTVLLVLGALLFMSSVVIGHVVDVHQIQWLGMMLLVFVALKWAFPPRFGKDILAAIFVLYWIHPLPRQIFGPLQLQMQTWSVDGAEWMLHCINVSVWADGITLFNGFDQITVPDVCSGMSTGTVVAYTVLGVALIFRLAWFETLFFVVLGLAQVLFVNMFRIAIVTNLAPKMDAAWTENFLHDTLGIFLLGTIMLSQAELSLYKAFKSRRHAKRTGIASGELENVQKASNLPRFWYLLFRWSFLLVFGMVCIGGVSTLAYKSRPSHREEMRRRVIDGLIQSDLAKAEEAVMHALGKAPGNHDLSGQRAQILVKRNKFDEAVAVFDEMPNGLSAYQTVLKSFCLMSLGKPEAAVVLIDALPANARKFPGVAMIRAEYAAYRNEPDLAGQYLRKAAHTVIDLGRVRALFPYLARHQQWAAIAACEDDGHYEDSGIAQIVMHAQIRTSDIKGLQRTMRHVLQQFPEDTDFLKGIFHLAFNRPGSEWEDRFARLFESKIDQLGVDEITVYMGYCFQLFRPDLGWRAYARLMKMDPTNPDVNYTPAQFGHTWYVFRKHHLSLGGERTDVVDLRPIKAMTQGVWPFRRLWRNVPLGEELGSPRLEMRQGRFLARVLETLQQREVAGKLTRRDYAVYPGVLSAMGSYDEAHEKLDELAAKFENLKVSVLLQHVELYDRESRWQEAYDASREYTQLADFRELKGDLFYINALLNLGFGVGALHVSQSLSARFPDHERLPIVEAAVWDIFGHDEQAYHLLRNRSADIALYPTARLAVLTGRMLEAERLHNLIGIPVIRENIASEQELVPLVAETTLSRARWEKAPDPASETADAVKYLDLAKNSTNVFLRESYLLKAQWLKSGGRGKAGQWQTWEQLGRDAVEKADLLHQVAIMAARHGAFSAALDAESEAIKHLPKSPVLHRTLIALSEGDAERIASARLACPTDGEIWLAELVSRLRAGQKKDAIALFVGHALRNGDFPARTWVRAGDLCLRNEMVDIASAIAARAVAEAKGLLCAYALALQCAMQNEDSALASAMARKGIENAFDPTVFYKAIVWIKTTEVEEDADMVSALEYLRKEFPKDTEWAEQLSHVFFQKGDTKRALSILEPVMGSDVRALRVRSVRLAAEAARQEGQRLKAIRILESALKSSPDDLAVLNNLIYNLALVPDGVPRARELLPKLVDSGNNSFVILDTIAMVYMRSGDLDRARIYMDEAMGKIRDDAYSATETRLNHAELLYSLGQIPEARSRIMDMRKRPDISSNLDARAKRLLDSIRVSESQKP